MHSSRERTEEAFTMLPRNALPYSAFYIPGTPGGPQPGDRGHCFTKHCGWLVELLDQAFGVGIHSVWHWVTSGNISLMDPVFFHRQKTGRSLASSDPPHCCSSKEYMTPDRCYSHLLLRRAEGRATASLSRLCFITLKVGNLLCNMEPEYALLQIKLNSSWPFPDSYRGPFYSLVSLLQSLHSGKYITSSFVSSLLFQKNKPHSLNLSL